MKYIEEVRDRHKGSEIWVIGTGPSLDDFPANFFDDKISIALNFTFIAFPRCTYIHFYHRLISKWILNNKPELLKKSIITMPHERYILTIPQLETYLGSLPDEMLYVTTYGRASAEEICRSVDQMMDTTVEKRSYSLRSITTILHPAIQIAAILGASKVTLAGCEASTLATKDDAHGKGMDPFSSQKKDTFSIEEQKGEVEPYTSWRFGVVCLAKKFGRYGINIKRYFYGSGYEKIV